jgi:hypothetical protein
VRGCEQADVAWDGVGSAVLGEDGVNVGAC